MLRLVKTDTGNCKSCGSTNRISVGNSGNIWRCEECSLFIPRDFSVFDGIRNDISKLRDLNSELGEVRKHLEKEFP